MDNRITFIIPNRGGKHIDIIINRLHITNKNDDIIVVTQDDDTVWAKGHLINIGVSLAKTKYVCILDNDMFWSRYINLIQEFKTLDCLVMQPFNIITQIDINDDNTCTIFSSRQKTNDETGGCWFTTKENFEKIGGMSNLYFQYGYEDNDFKCRCNDYQLNSFKSIEAEMYHIRHEIRNPWLAGPNSPLWFHTNINKETFDTRLTRNILDDNYTHTSYQITFDKINNSVRYIGVTNLYVKPKFKYIDILDKHNIKY